MPVDSCIFAQGFIVFARLGSAIFDNNVFWLFNCQ